MIKIENVDVFGWSAAIRGMRNPMNSWDKSDSGYRPIFDRWDLYIKDEFAIGKNDLKLMYSLSKAGNDHAKFLRMINVTCDIVAPRYWWIEFDTYKIATVCNSCSTMHKITEKEFTLDDFSTEHLEDFFLEDIRETIKILNQARSGFLRASKEDKPLVPAKDYWWQIIQLLPQSYNQCRTVHLNYQVLKSMYHARKNHKLDCWRAFCGWCESLPYFKEICVDVED